MGQDKREAPNPHKRTQNFISPTTDHNFRPDLAPARPEYGIRAKNSLSQKCSRTFKSSAAKTTLALLPTLIIHSHITRHNLFL